jgi:hypothetical protein
MRVRSEEWGALVDAGVTLRWQEIPFGGGYYLPALTRLECTEDAKTAVWALNGHGALLTRHAHCVLGSGGQAGGMAKNYV